MEKKNIRKNNTQETKKKAGNGFLTQKLVSRSSLSFILKLNLALAIFFIFSLLASAVSIEINQNDLNLSYGGNISMNSGALFVDATNKRVGIGTTSPQEKLQVATGLIRFNDFHIRNSFNISNSCGGNWLTDVHSGIYAMDYSGGCGDEWHIAETDRDGGEASTLVIAQQNDGNDHIALMPSGNVGIGTMAPSYPLHLYRASSETGALLSWGATNVYLSHGGWAMGAGKFGIGSGSIPTLTIDTNTGNVGIGTTSPSGKLAVAGEGTGVARIGVSGCGGDYVGIGLFGAMSSCTNYALLGSTGNNLFINRPTGGNIYFRENNADQMFIKTGGNVGIGTTSPAQKLEVNGNVKATSFIGDGSQLTGVANIPSGMIAMFDTSCPSGWTRVAAFDGRFIRGSATYGGTGGVSTHTHSVDPPATNTGYSDIGDAAWTDWGDPLVSRDHVHTVDIPEFNSASANNIPPYIDVVFCRKN